MILLYVYYSAAYVCLLYFQFLVTDNQFVKSCVKHCVNCIRKKQSSSMYKMIKREISSPDWPPVGQITHAPTGYDTLDTTSVTIETIPLQNSLIR